MSMLELNHLETVLARAEVIHTERQVAAAIDRMAETIRRDYERKNPLMICVMRGGLYTAAELYRRLQFPMQQDYMHVSRYRNDTSGGAFEWKVKPATALKGRHVLIMDDILDEGITLREILRYCSGLEAASVEVAALTRKLHNRCVDGAGAKYIGLDVPDKYVFGCGMDYQGYFRNLNAIHALP
ncbi:MAG TPA: hypoxanthine-guanine phosphoribosyltransferase [Gammaproteobacteria bacterium]|nr:hypoxanthine-guanine phosphoribosyltransferase [Gammaproteobacteria bacterium]